MSLLAGWIQTSVTGQAAKKLLDLHIADAHDYTVQNAIIESSPFYTLTVSQKKITQHRGVVLINAGKSAFERSAKTIIDDYQTHSEYFLGICSTDQTLVIIDPEQHKLVLATDPIGLTQLYYAIVQQGIVFGTTADSVIRHPEVKADISSQSIYDYVYFHHCPSPNTIYQQVKKLEGGQRLVYQDGKVKIDYYWLPQFSEQAPASMTKMGEQLRHKLIDSVSHLAIGAKTTGAFLSGGLDSSSIAGALSQVYPGQARTFSIGFPVEGYNEIEYANIAVKHFHTRQCEYYLTPEDTIKAIPDIAAYYDEPFGNSSALAAYYCAKLGQKEGIELMLGGDGGDEIFAGNERYAQQIIFDFYQKVPRWLGSALEGGLNHLPAFLAQQKLFFKAKRYIEQANTPLPDRLQDYNFLHRHSSHEIFQTDFLQSVDTSFPLNLLRDTYQRPEQASHLNRMLYMDWKTTLHDNDLVKVNKMCEMAGVEVDYPLLSQAIVELSCQIPSAEKLQAKALRKFYKHAMKGFLPDEILFKSKHGFGLPFGVWLKDYQPLQTLAYDSINSLKKRPYFKTSFLDHAIKMHQSIHAAYYGELIWILMMLELWFQRK